MHVKPTVNLQPAAQGENMEIEPLPIVVRYTPTRMLPLGLTPQQLTSLPTPQPSFPL